MERRLKNDTRKKANKKYIIEEGDTLEIKSDGGITNILINENKIEFVTEVKFTQKVSEKPVIEIERFFISKDKEKK